MESPLQVDDPGALFRVHCPTCRTNVWAGLEEPPSSGDDVLAEHDCPGPEAAEVDDGTEERRLRLVTSAPRPAESLASGDETVQPLPDSPSVPVSGYPGELTPPVSGPEDSPRS